MCIYDINNIYELWIKNRSESDLCCCETTQAVTKKALGFRLFVCFFHKKIDKKRKCAIFV